MTGAVGIGVVTSAFANGTVFAVSRTFGVTEGGSAARAAVLGETRSAGAKNANDSADVTSVFALCRC